MDELYDNDDDSYIGTTNRKYKHSLNAVNYIDSSTSNIDDEFDEFITNIKSINGGSGSGSESINIVDIIGSDTDSEISYADTIDYDDQQAQTIDNLYDENDINMNDLLVEDCNCNK